MPVEETTGRPVVVSGQELNAGNAQIRTLLNRQKERILAECQAEIKKHEFQADYDRRSIQKLGQIQLKNFNDEINNFFMNGYCSKIQIYVKLMRKVSQKWKS